MVSSLPPIDFSDARSLWLLQRVLDTIPDPVFIKDRQHRWIAFNAGFCRLVGYSRDALLGRGGETLTVTVSVETPYVREDDGALSETWRILLKAPPG